MTALKVWQYNLELAFPWTVAGGNPATGKLVAEQVFVKIRDDSVSGIGEAAPPARYGESAQTVLDFLAKVDPARLSFDDLEASWQYIDSIAPGNHSAKAAVEVALFDGTARKAGLPLHRYLGLEFKEGCHLTSYSIGIDQPDVIRRKVVAASDYPVLKLKMGGPFDRSSLQITREVAPTKWIRVDANEGWLTREQALENIDWLAADGRIQFVEQPMPANSRPTDLAWLKQRSPLPIFADESFRSHADTSLCADCFDGVNVKLAKCGGISGAHLALSAARSAGLRTMIGCMIESSLLISAAAHLVKLADYIDLDGNLLITNDPVAGATAVGGMLSFASAPDKTGIQACLKPHIHYRS